MASKDPVDLRASCFEMLAKWRRLHPLQLCINVSVLILPALLLTVDRADSAALVLLTIGGLFIGFRRGFIRGLEIREKVLILVFALMFAVVVACFLLGNQTDVGFRILGRYLRLLLFTPAYLVFRRFTPNKFFVFIGIGIGSIVCAIYAFVIVRQSGDATRVTGIAGDAIAFGDIALVNGFWSLSLILLASHSSYRRYLYRFAALGFFSGLVAVFFSGSRGGWSAIPVLVVISVIVLVHFSRAVLWRTIIGFVIILIVALSVVSPQLVRGRISAGLKNIDTLFKYRELDARLIDKRGCVNDLQLLKGIVRTIQHDGYLGQLDMQVTDDGAEFASSSWDKRCISPFTIRIRNTSKTKDGAFTIPRNANASNKMHKIAIVARGVGALRLNGGTRKVATIDSPRYTEVQLSDKMTMEASPYPIIMVPPGSELDFVPFTLRPNEYAWFYATDPVSERFEMWQAAWMIFKAHPILGAGTGAFKDLAWSYADRGAIPLVAADYDHPHNDYLNVLYGGGILGLAAFLLLLGWPGYIYVNVLRKSLVLEAKAAAFCGVMMISAILIYGLTESMFVHSLVLSWYVIMTALFSSLIRTYDVSHVQS